jgi:hypothetical protein
MASRVDLKDIAQMTLADRTPPALGDIYQHYKGGLYVVVCCSVHEETLDHLVTYRCNKRGTMWTRTLQGFTEPVGISPEIEVPRFRRVST